MFESKRLLRSRVAHSTLDQFADNSMFARYIPNQKSESTPSNEEIKRLILCSGQIYYDLAAHRETGGQHDIAIARVEQLSPFPFDRVLDNIRAYPNLKSVVWCQEEPMNAGPWSYVSDRLWSCLRVLNNPGIKRPLYAGRDSAASPAVGDAKAHVAELETLVNDAFDLNREENSWFENYLKT
eukprot:Selendium_serpulae@DN6091_c0_g1_i2.p2